MRQTIEQKYWIGEAKLHFKTKVNLCGLIFYSVRKANNGEDYSNTNYAQEHFVWVLNILNNSWNADHTNVVPSSMNVIHQKISNTMLLVKLRSIFAPPDSDNGKISIGNVKPFPAS